jgi:hypothetical protein
MGTWKQELNLNSILREAESLDLDDDDVAPTELKKKIKDELYKAKPLQSLADEVEMAETISDVDYILEDVYLQADIHKIWLGI